MIWVEGSPLLMRDFSKANFPWARMLGASRTRFSLNAPISFGVGVPSIKAADNFATWLIGWQTVHPDHPFPDLNGASLPSGESSWEDWMRRVIGSSAFIDIASDGGLGSS